jgi:hypothetical protein
MSGQNRLILSKVQKKGGSNKELISKLMNANNTSE